MFRRLGIEELTRRRIAWIAERATRAFYFANSLNRPTIDLHLKFGCTEFAQNFHFPGVTFSAGGHGILFSVELPHSWPSAS